VPDQVVIDADVIGALLDALHDRGYTVIGPTVRDGAIVLAELSCADELPYGWGVSTDAGRYRLRERGDRAAFAHSAGPQSWKTVLYPPRARMWSADRLADGTVAIADEPARQRYALLGVRPCDLRALSVLDRVLAGGQHTDPVYGARREGVFVVAVDCTEPSETCFCVSMGGGPRADGGFDLALTEVVDEGAHRFVARAGSAEGTDVLAQLRVDKADEQTVWAANEAVADAATRMGRAMPEVDLHDLMAASRNSPHWTDVAQRCLTCGNCTLVCPTCFCTSTEEITDLTGQHAERWRVWDSCFALDFTYMHGGEIRTSGASRYRQWISHKLGNWHEQFGTSGCVGCGRCVAWCPAGIDITAEARALVAADQTDLRKEAQRQ
jgi:ferredoxin